MASLLWKTLVLIYALLSLTAKASSAPASPELLTCRDSLDGVKFENFATNTHAAGYIYLTWIRSKSDFKDLIKVVNNQYFWTRNDVLYKLAVIADDEFQEDNKELLEPYMKEGIDTIDTSTYSLYEGLPFKLSLFPPRKEFKSRTLRWALKFAFLDQRAIKLWPHKYSGYINEFARSITKNIPVDRRDRYYQSLEKTADINWRWLCTENFLEDFSNSFGERNSVSTLTMRSLNIAILRLIDGDFKLAFDDQNGLPERIESSLIVADHVFWKLVNRVHGEHKPSGKLLLRLGMKNRSLYGTITGTTKITYDVLKSLKQIPNALFAVYLASVKTCNEEIQRRVLECGVPFSDFEIQTLYWFIYVYGDKSIWKSVNINTPNNRGIPLPLNEDPTDEYQIIAKLILVPPTILVKFQSLFYDTKVDWIYDSHYPRPPKGHARQFLEELRFNSVKEPRFARAIKAELDSLWSVENNEALLAHYVDTLCYFLLGLNLSKDIFNHSVLLDVEPGIKAFRSTQPDGIVLKEVNEYWFIVDTNETMKATLLKPGSILTMDDHLVVLGTKVGSFYYKERLKSNDEFLSVVQPLIATGLVHVPKPSDQIIFFELFCRIIKRLQDLGNFTMTKKICKMIGKQSILELLLDWNIEGFEFGELLNIPSHHIHWDVEKEAYIMKLDEMIIITSETMCFTIHSLGILEAEISEDLELVVRLEFPESEHFGKSVQKLTVNSAKDLMELVGFSMKEGILSKFPTKEFFKIAGSKSIDEINSFLEHYDAVVKLLGSPNTFTLVCDSLFEISRFGEPAILRVQTGCDFTKLVDSISNQVDSTKPRYILNTIAYGLKMVRIIGEDIKIAKVLLGRLRELMRNLESKDVSTWGERDLRLLALLALYFNKNTEIDIFADELIDAAALSDSNDITSTCVDSLKAQKKIASRFFAMLSQCASHKFDLVCSHPVVLRVYLPSLKSQSHRLTIVDHVYSLNGRLDLWKTAFEMLPEISPCYESMKEMHLADSDTFEFIVNHYQTDSLLRVILIDGAKISPGCPLYDLCNHLKNGIFPDSRLPISRLRIILDWLRPVSLKNFDEQFFVDVMSYCFSSAEFMSIWETASELMPGIRPGLKMINRLVEEGRHLCIEAIGKYRPDSECPTWSLILDQFDNGTIKADTLKALEKFAGFSKLVNSRRDDILKIYENYCTSWREIEEMLKVLHWLAQSQNIYPPSSMILALANSRRYDLMMLLVSLGVNFDKKPFSYMLWNSRVSRDEIVGSSMYLLMRDNVDGVYVNFEGEDGSDAGGPSGEWATLVMEELLKDEKFLPRYRPTGSDEEFVFPTLNHNDPLCVAKLRLLALVHAVCLRRNKFVDGEMAPVCYTKALETYPSFTLDDMKAVDAQTSYALERLSDMTESELAGEGLYLQSGAPLTLEDLQIFITQEVEKFFEGFLIYSYEFKRLCNVVYRPSSPAQMSRNIHGSAGVTVEKILSVAQILILDSKLKKQFKEALTHLTSEELCCVVMLWTGSKRLASSASAYQHRPTVQVSAELGNNAIPTAITCFNRLMLGSSYDSVEHLVRALRTFMVHGRLYTHS